MEGTTSDKLAQIVQAIDRNEFFLEYLPTIVLKTGRCAGSEALIRWRHDGKIIPPMEFIPLVENTPVSGLLTYWVVEEVGRELGQWLERQSDSVHIGINIPPELLGRGGLEYAGKKAHLDKVAHKIVLEVSERGIIDQLGIRDLNERVGRRALIALDDVQLKEINTLLLARLKVDIIRLDKAVTDLLDKPQVDPQIVRTLRALASAPGLSIIGEGIESERQAKTLEEIGIEYGQGYYFSKPISAKAFMDFFAERPYPAASG